MLDTTIYNAAMHNLLDNMRSAQARRDDEQTERNLRYFLKMVKYAEAHGLSMDIKHGQFQFKRNGYAPNFLYINTGDGQAFYTPPIKAKTLQRYYRMQNGTIHKMSILEQEAYEAKYG